MQEGLYERLVTERLERELVAIRRSTEFADNVRRIDAADQPEVLSRHIRDAALRTLSSTQDVAKRLEIVNGLLALLDGSEDDVLADPRQLLSLTRVPQPGVVARPDTRPSTPLSDAALLTNAHGEPSLGAELRAELDSSDQVDLLCAFVRWHGLRVLEPELVRLRERGAPLHVITTTYIGATERVALIAWSATSAPP